MVSPRHVVAVAHCFLDEILLKDPEYCKFKALVGTNCLHHGGDQYDIQHVEPHEHFMKTDVSTAYDIAVAIVSCFITLKKLIQ